MPISAAKRAFYPSNWADLSRRIRTERAQGRCECEGECESGHSERCGAFNGAPHPLTGSRVVLTVAHLDHDPTGDDPENLRAMCQKCHLSYDRHEHRTNAAETRAVKRDQATGQRRLF